MSKKDMVGRRKLLLEDFVGGVTLHGFRFLFEGSVFRRFLWFLITFGTFIFSAVLSFAIVKDFLEFKTVTFTTTNYEVPTIYFPTITICPINYVSRKKIRNLPGNITATDFFHVFIQSSSGNGLNSSDPITNRTLETLYKRNVTSARKISELFQFDMSDIFNSTILSHLYKHTCIYDDTPCTLKNFKMITSSTYTFCWQFNSYTGDMKDALTAGKNKLASGLLLTLNLHTEESVFARLPYEGVVLRISNYGDPYHLTEYMENLALPVGSFSAINLSTRKVMVKSVAKTSERFKDH